MSAPGSELCVIAGILADGERARYAAEWLTPEMFSDAFLGGVFSAALDLYAKGKAPDIAMIEQMIGQEHRAQLVKCVDYLPSMAGYEDYCHLVIEEWRRRVIRGKMDEILLSAESSREMASGLREIVDSQSRLDAWLGDETVKGFSAAVEDYLASLGRPNDALRTGWSGFDRCTGGLQREGFYIIAGRPGTGKTDFSLSMAVNMATKYQVLYCSMEMSRNQLLERVASRMGRIDSAQLLSRNLTDAQRETAREALNQMKQRTRMQIDEQPRVSVMQLEGKITRYHPDVVFLDHVGLMDHGQGRRALWEGVTDTSNRLKELARKYRIVIVGLVQENREAVGSKKPSGANLRGSDALLQDADGLFQMKHDEEDADAVAERIIRGDGWIDAGVHITKNRYGPTGALRYHWQPQYHEWREEASER